MAYLVRALSSVSMVNILGILGSIGAREEHWLQDVPCRFAAHESAINARQAHGRHSSGLPEKVVRL